MTAQKVEQRKLKVNATRGRVTSACSTHELVPALLAWFTQNARDLPWRHTRDPYAIWVSEIMLQQTQVKTVIPYWERWMRELPTLDTLAAAKLEKVLKLWEGLGYYTRVRNMQKAAQVIGQMHAGQFPKSFEDVLALPGIGRYTAGAICSIAFNEPRPILDGNVIRVLTRVFNIAGDPREKTTNARLWQLAESLVAEASALESPSSKLKAQNFPQASHLNQSLMELGALLCTPRQPKCLLCPVQTRCLAREQGTAEKLPNLGERLRPTARRFIAFVVEHRGRFLVRQRPTGVVNAHFWEFPNVEISETPGDLIGFAQEKLGLKLVTPSAFVTVNHSITRYRISLAAFRSTLQGQPGKNNVAERWLSLTDLEALAFTSAHRKILRKLIDEHEASAVTGVRAARSTNAG